MRPIGVIVALAVAGSSNVYAGDCDSAKELGAKAMKVLGPVCTISGQSPAKPKKPLVITSIVSSPQLGVIAHDLGTSPGQ